MDNNSKQEIKEMKEKEEKLCSVLDKYIETLQETVEILRSYNK